MLGIILHDHLDGPWDDAKGFLREELENLHTAIQQQFGKTFTKENDLQPTAISDGLDSLDE